MKISIITLFPEIFKPYLSASILGRAQKKGLVEFEVIALRDFGEGKHKTVDDRPYGGGAGMVLKPDVLAHALKSVISTNKISGTGKFQISNLKFKIILMSASGTPYKQQKVEELSKLDHLTLVCGHYEGVDQRFIESYVDEEISIGDYILTGGELPTMVVIDSIVRLLPGVLEKPEATSEESFSSWNIDSKKIELLEYPQYTRPEVFEGKKVPEVLLSGNHQDIKSWRQKEALKKTSKIRPDLIKVC